MSMTTSDSNKLPAVILDQLNHVFDFHSKDFTDD